MSQADARRHFEEYVARAEVGSERLRRTVEESGTTLDLGGSPESLAGLWSWFLGHATTLEKPCPFDDPAALPAWVDVDRPVSSD